MGMGLLAKLFGGQPPQKSKTTTKTKMAPGQDTADPSPDKHVNFVKNPALLDSLTTENVADRNAWLRDQEQQKERIRRPLSTADRLTRDGYCAESQDMLLPLLKQISDQHSYMRGVISEKIAANYHQMRQYDEEITFLQDFLQTEKSNPQYRQYERKFTRTIARAQTMKQKGNLNDHL